jgi:hypothetical protein
MLFRGAYGEYAPYSILHGGTICSISESSSARLTWLTAAIGVHFFAGGMWNTTGGGLGMGDFLDPYTSPNDPIWWSHHANLGTWNRACTWFAVVLTGYVFSCRPVVV